MNNFFARYEFTQTTNWTTMPPSPTLVTTVHAVPEGPNAASDPCLCRRPALLDGDLPDRNHPELEFSFAVRVKKLSPAPGCSAEYNRLTGGQ